MVRILAKAPSSPRAAFTLAEIIIALGLFLIVILTGIALAISALRGNQIGSDQMVASSLAAQVLEKFVYDLPTSTDTFWTLSAYTSPYATQNVAMGPSAFQANVFVSDASGALAGMKTVTVNVSWGSGPNGRTGYGQQVTSLSRLIYAH